jgi:hypothetical protein
LPAGEIETLLTLADELGVDPSPLRSEASGT